MIIQIIFILFIVMFLIAKEFIIAFEINDFIYSFSSSYFFLFIFIFFVIIFILQSIYFKSKFIFFKFKLSQKIKQKEKGYNSFVNGMLALANKDFKKAITESNKAANYLDTNTSLSLLLKSEIYKIDKKQSELNKVYEEMIKHDSTKNLGFRGLMEQYLLSHDYHHAFIYAEKLFSSNPYVEKIYETLVSILIKTNNWQQLINISEIALSKKIISKEITNTNKSIAYYEIAKIKLYSEVNESVNLIKKSLKIRKNFAPYVKLYLSLLIQNNNLILAKKFFKKVWSESPHPELKNIISFLAKELKIKKSDLVKYIISSNPNNYESQIMLTENLILENNWKDARQQLQSLLDVKPKKEVCLLMAKIEEGESGDVQKINAWSLRARNGLENKMWVCFISKKKQREWTSISEGGHFNSLEWRQPIMLNQFDNNDNLLNHVN